MKETRVTFTVSAVNNDIPPQPIAYSLGSGAASGATINPTTGVFSWTPTAARHGVRFDHGLRDQRIAPAQHLADLHGNRGRAAGLRRDSCPECRPGADPGPVREPLRHRSQLAQAGDRVQPGRGNSGGGVDQRIDRFPHLDAHDGSAPGSYAIAVFATDNASPPLFSLRTFTVQTIVAPVLAAIPAQSVTQGQNLTLSVAGYVSDPNLPERALTYSLDPGAPAGVRIDPSSGLVTWTPALSVPVGTYTIAVRATDSASTTLAAAESFSVNVQYGGPPPTVIGTSVSTKHGLTITITFSQAMDAGSVDNPSNYQLFLPGKGKKSRGKTLALTPSSNGSSNVVTLKARGTIKLSPKPQLTIFGSAPGRLANSYGMLLDGDLDGLPGSNYVAVVSKHDLSRVPSFALARVRLRSGAYTLERPEGASRGLGLGAGWAAAFLPECPSSGTLSEHGPRSWSTDTLLDVGNSAEPETSATLPRIRTRSIVMKSRSSSWWTAREGDSPAQWPATAIVAPAGHRADSSRVPCWPRSR